MLLIFWVSNWIMFAGKKMKRMRIHHCPRIEGGREKKERKNLVLGWGGRFPRAGVKNRRSGFSPAAASCSTSGWELPHHPGTLSCLKGYRAMARNHQQPTPQKYAVLSSSVTFAPLLFPWMDYEETILRPFCTILDFLDARNHSC